MTENTQENVEERDNGVNAPFYVADWYVEPATGRISAKGADTGIRVEPKAMAVLVCLAQRQGQVISREALEEVVWHDVVVGYDSLASAIIKLRKAFGDSAKNPEVIETVPKKGYRLIASVQKASRQNPSPPVTDNTDFRGSAETLSSTGQQSKPIIFNRKIILVIILLALAIALFPFGLYQQIKLPAEVQQAENRIIIAVLPFNNISDDKQQDYFSDGITVDLITDLSRVSGLSVIARNSVFSFKNSDTDIRTVQRELGVDYVVEGSVRKIANQVRVSARLINARNNINVWAERFDGSLDNIFAFQDAVISQIISALSIKLTEQDKNRLADKYSDSIEAYDRFLHGWQNLWLSSREGNMNAREDFYKAIELDNRFARAYANLALTYVYDYLHGWTDNDELALQKAHEYADKAISLHPSLPQVYWVKGFAEIFKKNYQQAIDYAQKSIDLSPNYADGYGLLANTLNYAGKAEEAGEVMSKAMQLNPRHPAIYKVIYGEILFNRGDYKGAIKYLSEALNSNPEIEESRIWLAAAYANAGNIEEASWQLEQVKVSGRELSLQRLEKVIPFKDPEQRKVFIDGLYKAGIAD